MNIAIVQPSPGIGDFIWHVPHVRSIAAKVGSPVTLIAKPATLADQTFWGDPCIRDIIWLDRNQKKGRGRHDRLGMLRLASELKQRHFDAVYLLSHSKSLAFTLLLAQIPARYGYGDGFQRVALNRHCFLPASAKNLHPFDKASLWLRQLGIPLVEDEPRLSIDATLLPGINATDLKGSYVVLGIGSSDPSKQWGAAHFSWLAEKLLQAGWDSVVLAGGSREADLAQSIRESLSNLGSRIIFAIDWHLAKLAALCNKAGFYVGNDTGSMNLAAASGITAYGIFGNSEPLRHSSRIISVTHRQGADISQGIESISGDDVLAAIHTHRCRIGP